MSRTATDRHRNAQRLGPAEGVAPLDVRGISAERQRLRKQFPAQLTWRRRQLPPK